MNNNSSKQCFPRLQCTFILAIVVATLIMPVLGSRPISSQQPSNGNNSNNDVKDIGRRDVHDSRKLDKNDHASKEVSRRLPGNPTDHPEGDGDYYPPGSDDYFPPGGDYGGGGDYDPPGGDYGPPTTKSVP